MIKERKRKKTMENVKTLIVKNGDIPTYKIKITSSQNRFLDWLITYNILDGDITIEDYEDIEALDFTKF